MNKQLLKQVLVEQRETLLKKDLGIERTLLGTLSEKIKLPFVHIITGIRRCGKSTFLHQIINRYFKDTGFYYINFEDERLFNFNAQDFNDIYEALVELFGRKKTFFIDEIQNISYFETFVRRFTDEGFKFFLTGSNAKLLSTEIASKLTGRHINTHLQPFSFEEFLKFNNYLYHRDNVYKTTERATIKTHFNDYIKTGGMPEYVKYRDPEIIFRTYEDIVIKDIAVRHKISNILQLKELSQYLVSNFGRRVSFTSLKNALHFGSVNTVKNYIQFMEDSFLTKRINRFDHSIKKQLVNEKKIYVVDNGFISNVSLLMTRDSGRLLENLVFNSLLPSHDVYYYSDKNECDFVCINNKSVTKLIQVTQELNENNTKREVSGLVEAMKFFNVQEGLILTYDTDSEIKTDSGLITLTPVWKFILQE